MGRFVIAAFKPKPGMQEQLLAVVARHWAVLRAEKLVSGKPSHVMRASDGTIVEVFEWNSSEAIERAHTSADVQALWEEFSAVCEYVPVGGLAECQHMFSEFDAIDW
jgi:quinol monooxygenase YgiN